MHVGIATSTGAQTNASTEDIAKWLVLPVGQAQATLNTPERAEI